MKIKNNNKKYDIPYLSTCVLSLPVNSTITRAHNEYQPKLIGPFYNPSRQAHIMRQQLSNDAPNPQKRIIKLSAWRAIENTILRMRKTWHCTYPSRLYRRLLYDNTDVGYCIIMRY